MADKGILKPQYGEIQELWRRKEQEVAQKSGVDPEDQHIYTLASMPGWVALKKHINNLKKDLDEKLAKSVAMGMSDVDIGKNTILTVMVKDSLDSIINKVEDTASAVEQITNEANRGE